MPGRSPLLLSLLLVTVVFAGCVNNGGTDSAAAAAWSVVDSDGVAHSRQSLTGDPALLFFMATWCSTCASMTGDLADVHGEYAARGLQMLSISWDPGETQADLDRWKDRHAQDWPHGIDREFLVHRAYDVRIQSTVVLLDADGELVKKWGFGQASASALKAAIEPLLDA